MTDEVLRDDLGPPAATGPDWADRYGHPTAAGAGGWTDPGVVYEQQRSDGTFAPMYVLVPLAQPAALAARLTAVREAAGLTAAQLADRLGCSESTVSRTGAGKVTPSRKRVRDWADACGASVDVHQELLLILAEINFQTWQTVQRARLGMPTRTRSAPR